MIFKNQAYIEDWYLWVCVTWGSFIGFEGTNGPWWRYVLYWVPFYSLLIPSYTETKELSCAEAECQSELAHCFTLYLHRHVLEVVSSPADHISKAEDRAVLMILCVVGASSQVAVIRGFKDVRPKRWRQEMCIFKFIHPDWKGHFSYPIHPVKLKDENHQR